MKNLIEGLCLGALFVAASGAAAQEMPTVRIENGASQFLVQGKPLVKETVAAQQNVLMVQVENEIGYLGVADGTGRLPQTRRLPARGRRS